MTKIRVIEFPLTFEIASSALRMTKSDIGKEKYVTIERKIKKELK